MSLDGLMRSVLAELEILGAPRAGQMHYGSRGESDYAGPPFVEDRVGYWRRRYESLDNDHARRECIRAALDEVRSVRYGIGKADTRLREARLKIGTDGRPASIVAYVHQCSLATVYRLRAEATAAGLRTMIR